MDPFSIAWFKVEGSGCSSACLELGQASLQNRSCEDSPVDDSWRAFWDLYPAAMSTFFGNDVDDTQVFQDINRTLTALKQIGCPALSQFPSDFLTGAVWCDGKPGLLRPLTSICPQACGCENPSPQPSAYCPQSCSAGNRQPPP